MLAQHLDYLYFDTGCMYRAVTLVSLRLGKPIEHETIISNLAATITIDIQAPTVEDGRQYTVFANREDITWEIRSPKVDRLVSTVSAYSGVRQVLTKMMRTIAQRGSLVMVGRDIGTVVLPDARLKLFIDASIEERARRRHKENMGRGIPSSYKDVLYSLQSRDQTDSHRHVAPLRAAPDAHVIDTTRIGPDEVLAKVLALIPTDIDCPTTH